MRLVYITDFCQRQLLFGAFNQSDNSSLFNDNS